MSKIGKTVQALAGLLAAAAAGLAAGTWILPAENDLIAAFGGFRITGAGIGAALSLLTVLGFADGWIGSRNRRLPAAGGAGRILNGLGFGFLPGAAVWKIFEQRTSLGQGTALPEGWQDAWIFSAGGRWLPGRTEIMLALLLFGLLILWLALRKQELPENGDLAGVSLAMWGSVRLITESFRAVQIPLLGEARITGWIAAGVLAAVLAGWTVRTFRQKRNTGYALACIPVFLASIAGIVVIQNEILRTGIAAADLAMQICLALLAFKSVICMGRVSRRQL